MPPRLRLSSPLLKLSPTVPPIAHSTTSVRHFIQLPSAPQQFTATRTLPYPPRALYTLISDVDSYHKFLPYCLNSRVVTPQTKTKPALADLRVGFGNYDETFRSEVRCDEQSMTVVADGAKGGGGLFEVLVAKWRVMDDGSASGGRLHSGHGGKESDRSDVTLRIDYQFSNPLYGALSSAVIPKVAEVLIEAFEKRAAEVLGKRGNKMPNSGQIGVKVGA